MCDRSFCSECTNDGKQRRGRDPLALGYWHSKRKVIPTVKHHAIKEHRRHNAYTTWRCELALRFGHFTTSLLGGQLID